MPEIDQHAANQPASNASKHDNKSNSARTPQTEARHSLKRWQWGCAVIGLVAALEYDYQTGIRAFIPTTILGAMLGRTIDTRSFRHWPGFLLVMIVTLFTISVSPELKGSLAFNKGVESLKSQQYDDAIGFFTKAIEHAPENAQAYLNRGAARLQKGDPDAAILDFTRALEIDPNCGKAYANRGAAHNVLRRHEQAMEDCDNAIRLDPQCAKAYLGRAVALQELGNVAEAEIELEKALQLDPQLEQLLDDAVEE